MDLSAEHDANNVPDESIAISATGALCPWMRQKRLKV